MRANSICELGFRGCVFLSPSRLFLCARLIDSTCSISSPLPFSLDLWIRTFSFLFLFSDSWIRIISFVHFPSAFLLPPPSVSLHTVFLSSLLRFTCLGRFASDISTSASLPCLCLPHADLSLYRTITRVWRRPPGWTVAVQRRAVLVFLPLVGPSRWTAPPPLPPLPFPSFFSPLLCGTNGFV